MTVEVKSKITGIERRMIAFAFSGFNQHSPDDELQTPQPKQIANTVAFVSERRLKLKVYEVRLSLRHFFGYKSA